MRAAIPHMVLLIAACTFLSTRLAMPSWADGPDTPSDAPAEADREAPSFESKVRPLLISRCLECHDAEAHEGGLDLSARRKALAGGDSGIVLVPGRADESLLWQYVESDEMPKDRPPLSSADKALLRRWIDAGAEWPDAWQNLVADQREAVRRMIGLRRLTVREYIVTVRELLGVGIAADARRILPPDLRADGFRNTAYNLNVDLGHIQGYAELAEIIVGRMDVEQFVRQFIDETELSEENLARLISRIGKRLFRGPLEDYEREPLMAVARSIMEEGGDLHDVAGGVIEVMLQSPRFIYHVEDQVGDGTPRRLNDYELAARLSYIIWGGPPDAELLKAADEGRLSDDEQFAAQVTRMLEDPRAIEQSEVFLADWLNLDRLSTLQPNAERFPTWNSQLAADMREETLEFFREVVWRQKRPLSELMNAEVTFVTPRLAQHYGLEPKEANAEGRLPPPTPRQLPEGLLVLYTFHEEAGRHVRDVSDSPEPISLAVELPSRTRWTSEGLVVAEPTMITTSQSTNRIVEAVKESGEFTLEVWVTPGNTEQSGPARIVTLSSGPTHRNFTLGQDGDKFEVRFRTSRTNENGLPALSSESGTVKTEPTYIVYTRDAAGKATLYLNGRPHASQTIDGNLNNWISGYSLVLANESTGDRPWRGTLHRVALYDKVLSAEQVQANAIGLMRYDLADVPSRGGLLSHGSLLTIGGDEASMVARGLFVLHDLLHGKVSDPPPCVDTTPVPIEAGRSQRAIAEARLADRSCAGCHEKFEPLAFALERYDGIGAYNEVDHFGNRLREDGQVQFPGSDAPVAFQSAAEFMGLLADSDRVKMTMTRKLTQFALGRPLLPEDEPVVEAIHRQAHEQGGTYTALLRAIVASDLVRTIPTEPAAVTAREVP